MLCVVWNFVKTQVMEYGIVVMGIGELLLRWLLAPIYWWIERTPPQRIRPNEEPILKMSAKTLAHMIRNKEIKSETVVQAYINRIREVNPVLNAVVEPRYEAALEEARAVDTALQAGTPEVLTTEKPLLGVPVTIKESCGVAGMSHCVGLLSRKGVKCTMDGEAVALLRAAGAIPIAVSTTPELCLSWETVNLVTGRTVNPYNVHRTAGGSSGGEGALIGAGASVLGLGSDIAGSIRVPSHFNGIFGHKPTGGIVSIKGHYPNSTDEEFPMYLVVGPMTRYAEDLKVVMKIISGKNSKELRLDDKVDLSKLTVFHMLELSNKIYEVPVEEDIKEAITKCVKHLGHNCGSTISDKKFEDLYDSVEISVSVFFSVLKDIPNVLQNPSNPKESSNLILETMKSLLGMSEHSLNTMLFYLLKETNVFIPRSKTQMYVSMFNDVKDRIEKSLGTDGVFLYPTFPVAAFNHYGLFSNTAGVAYTMIFNLMGFPSTHVPMGLDRKNLPVGLQVIAARNQDRLCLAVAEELEKAFGGWIPPPTQSII